MQNENRVGDITTSGQGNTLNLSQSITHTAATPIKEFCDALFELARQTEQSPDVAEADRKKVAAEARRVEAELKADEPERDFVESAVKRIGQLLGGVTTLAPKAQQLGALLGRIWA